MDADVEIERQAGKSIAEIFVQDGEPAFRDLEESVIEAILAKEPEAAHSAAPGREIPFVLATGGGAILRSSTRERLRQSGRVIWLMATPETILHRITGDATSPTMRPNLTSLPLYEEIMTVLEQRKPLYAETAHETIDTDSQTADDIVDTIIAMDFSTNRR
jgi:shikimate kinase